MSFVKLDCGILDSTIWLDRDARELFLTALLMATPHELKEPARQLRVQSLEETGFTIPAGWYGKVEASGSGIIHRAGMELQAGLAALVRLGEPEPDSRTPDFEGRRLVRVSGGYLALNFAKYRDKDHTSAERSKRYRERKLTKPRKEKSTPISGENLGVKLDGEGHVKEAEALAAMPSEAIEQARLDDLPEGLQ